MKNSIRLLFGIAFITFLSVVAIALLLSANDDRPNRPVARAPRVVATFYPLGAIAQGVLGGRAPVSVIVPSGIEPHDYEPTPRDMISIREADIFLLDGAGMDPWAEALVSNLASPDARILKMTDGVDLLGSERGQEGHENSRESFDPHVWLDPVIASSFAERIRDALVEQDVPHAAEYHENTKKVLGKFSGIDRLYREGLRSCRKRSVVVSHDAFGYLARRYDFKTLPIAGISPESEPSARHMAELADLVKKENMRYIFFETIASPKVAETIAREAGAETLTLDPIEGIIPELAASGEDYFSLMEKNLKHLARALECQSDGGFSQSE